MGSRLTEVVLYSKLSFFYNIFKNLRFKWYRKVLMMWSTFFTVKNRALKLSSWIHGLENGFLDTDKGLRIRS